jgi:hypothetical protein
MKKTIRKPDGTVIEYEGTAEELKQLEPLDWPNVVSVPSIWTTPTYTVCDSDCYKCNGKPWFGVVPPTCTCKGSCWGKRQSLTVTSPGIWGLGGQYAFNGNNVALCGDDSEGVCTDISAREIGLVPNKPKC